MSQFDVHRNADRNAETAPYLLNIQHDRFAELRTRVMLPFIRGQLTGPMGRLHVPVTIAGEQFTLSGSELITLEMRRLGPVIQNIEQLRGRIIAALDLLFTGV